MAVLNVIAHIMLAISIFAFVRGVVTDETSIEIIRDFIFMSGYILTYIAYINK